jgi:amiloride-sensitive sodium channel
VKITRTKSFRIHYKNFHKTKVSHDWDLEHGYHPSVGLEAYPRRALYAGIPYALEISLTEHEDDLDYTCGSSVKGWKVQISHPQRMPRVRNQHFIVPLARVAKAGIAPDMMTTSAAVKAYNAKRRNCHFPSERSLKYFKVYSQNNCAIECRANYTYSQCGCVPFYVPSKTCCLELRLRHFCSSLQEKRVFPSAVLKATTV